MEMSIASQRCGKCISPAMVYVHSNQGRSGQGSIVIMVFWDIIMNVPPCDFQHGGGTSVIWESHGFATGEPPAGGGEPVGTKC